MVLGSNRVKRNLSFSAHSSIQAQGPAGLSVLWATNQLMHRATASCHNRNTGQSPGSEFVFEAGNMRSPRCPVGALGVPILSCNKMSSIITALSVPRLSSDFPGQSHCSKEAGAGGGILCPAVLPRVRSTRSLLALPPTWQETRSVSQLKEGMSSPTLAGTTDHREPTRVGRGGQGCTSHQDTCRVVRFRMG